MKLPFLNIIVVRRHLHCKSYRLSPWYIYVYICWLSAIYDRNTTQTVYSATLTLLLISLY
nr:ADM_HP1_G0049260.mRNA.1.CDS.1 [Saccharomyces cerevisiae]